MAFIKLKPAAIRVNLQFFIIKVVPGLIYFSNI
jgi:hypothetical protein